MKTTVVRKRKPEAAEVTTSEDGRPLVTTHDGVSSVGDTVHEAADRVTARLGGRA